MITIDGNTGAVVEHEASLEKLKAEVKDLPPFSLGVVLNVGLQLLAMFADKEARKPKKRLKRRRTKL